MLSKLPASQETVCFFSLLLTLWREKKRFYCRINSLMEKMILYRDGSTLSCSCGSEMCDFGEREKKEGYMSSPGTLTHSPEGAEKMLFQYYSQRAKDFH